MAEVTEPWAPTHRTNFLAHLNYDITQQKTKNPKLLNLLKKSELHYFLNLWRVSTSLSGPIACRVMMVQTWRKFYKKSGTRGTKARKSCCA